jgi:putative inorganic carbon (HCO3(-)) transporter
MHTYAANPASRFPSWKPIAAMVGCNLVLFASVMVLQSRAVWALAGVALCVFIVLTLRWPDWGTSVVLFTIYSNLAVALVRFNDTSNTVMDTDSRSALMAVVGLALFVPLFHYLWLRGDPFIGDRPFAIICMYACALLLSTMLCLDPMLATQKFIRFLCEGLVLYILVVNVVRDEPTLRKAMWALLLAASFMAFLSVYQEVTGTQDNTYWGLAQRGGVFAIGENGQEIITRTRAAGSIGEQNRYAQILLVVLPFAVFFFQHAKSGWVRILAAVSGVLVICGIVLTFSRGAFVALAMLFFVMGYLRFIRWSHLAIGVVLLSSYVVIHEPDYLTRMASLAQVHTLFDSSNQRPSADYSATERLAGNLASINVFMQHPILGVGRGVYGKYFATPAVYKLGIRQVRHYPSHNLYLNLAAESGILGLTLFMAVVVVIAKRLHRLYKLHVSADSELRDMCACFLLSICAYLLAGMFLHLGYERYFWLQMALCSAAVRIIADAVPYQVSVRGPATAGDDGHRGSMLPMTNPVTTPWPPTL